MKPVILLSILFSVINGFGAFAQSCPTEEGKAKEGALGYKMRNGRCEGLLTNWKVSGPEIQMISFTLGKPDFYPSEAEKILIKRAAIGNQNTMNVRGQSFDMRDLYRLDFTLDKNSEKVIPFGEVMYPAMITAEKFGVYGYEVVGKDVFYSPVCLVSNRLGGKVLKGNNYFVKVTVNKSLSDLSWEILPIVKNGYGEPGKMIDVPASNIKPNYVIIEIPKTMLAGKMGIRIWFDGGKRSRIYNLQV